MPDAERNMIEASLAEINTKLNTIIEQGKDHESRIRELEGKGGKKWESLTAAILSSLVVGIAGFFLGKLL